MLFDFHLLDGLEERDTAEGRCTFSLPGKAFGRDEIAGMIIVTLANIRTYLLSKPMPMSVMMKSLLIQKWMYGKPLFRR